MAEKISVSKGLTNPPIFDTYVPELSDNANIQNAFELFYYGNSDTGNTIDGTNSIYSNLIEFDTRIDSAENNISGHIGANSAHGATGAVVGTTDTQELTNKTLTSPKINENVNLTATSTELNILDGITTSTAELNHVDGVTSPIQTQIDSKLSISSASTTYQTIVENVSNTEIGYLDGVTSGIQTQINLKPTLSYEGSVVNRNIFVQAAQPTAVNIGDIWFDF
jgi:hypothetical protein